MTEAVRPLPAPALVVDGSQTAVFAGVLGAGGEWLARSRESGAPLERLFPAVAAVLEEAAVELDGLRALVYCEGPGSTLGLRLCAMALETWRRLAPAPPALFAYNSLELAAARIAAESPTGEAWLVSDWKKGAWHALPIRDGVIGALETIDDARLSRLPGPVHHLPQRKGWQAPPESARTVRYAPERIAGLLDGGSLLRPTAAVRLFEAAPPQFARWTPERHRA